MGTFHVDDECDKALIRLNDALCSFERSTGREHTLILVPHVPDENIFVSQGGKPLPPEDFDEDEYVLTILQLVLQERSGGLGQ